MCGRSGPCCETVVDANCVIEADRIAEVGCVADTCVTKVGCVVAAGHVVIEAGCCRSGLYSSRGGPYIVCSRGELCYRVGGLFEAGCVVEVRCAFEVDSVKWTVQSM